MRAEKKSRKNREMKNNTLRKIIILLLSIAFATAPLFACVDRDFDKTYDPLPELVIGSDDYAPYFFCDENGEFAGIDVEIAKEVCKIMGYTPRFVNIDWSDKDRLLKEGKIDCLWGSFSRTGRENEYSWSDPYLNSRQVVAVRADSTIEKIADLEGKRIAVQSSSKPDEIFSGNPSGRTAVPKIGMIYCFTELNQIFASISEGYVDAIAGHETALLEYMKTSTVKLKILDEPLLEVQLGIAFEKDTHADVIARLNQALSIIKNNGFIAGVAIKYGLGPESYTAV